MKNPILALIQLKCIPGNVDENNNNAVKYFEKAIKKKANIICFPEMFNTGFDAKLMGDQLFDLAENINGKTVNIFKKLCKKNNVHAVIPIVTKDDKTKKLYNTAFVIDNKGDVIQSYNKIHLWDKEKDYFTPGDKYCVFDTEYGRIAVMICYDIDFPEATRKCALAGAKLLILPTAWDYRHKDIYNIFIPSRALENLIFIAAINQYSRTSNVQKFGNSRLINPRGTIIAQLPIEEEGIIVQEIDLNQVDEYRKDFPYLEDRRPDTYIGILD